MRERKKRKALVKARLLMGLSQEKLAERIGVTRNTISEWERGVQHPYPLHVHALCVLFGQSAQELAIDARWRELEPYEASEAPSQNQDVLLMPDSVSTMTQEETASISEMVDEFPAREKTSHLFVASPGQILLLNDYKEIVAMDPPIWYDSLEEAIIKMVTRQRLQQEALSSIQKHVREKIKDYDLMGYVSY